MLAYWDDDEYTPQKQGVSTTRNLELEETGSVVDSVEGIGEHKRQDSHQLHDNVEGRSRGILERISDGVTDNGSLVDVRSLTLKLRIRGGLLDVLLGVIPSSSRVGHGNGKLDGGNESSNQETRDGHDTKQDSGEERGEDNHGTWRDHLLEGGTSRDGNAGIVVGTLGRVLVKKVGLLVELTLDFQHHLHGGQTDGLHGQSGKGKGDHSSNDEECKGEGVQDVHSEREQSVAGRVTDTGDEGSKESERHEGGGSDGESLSNSGRGVSSGVEGIGLFADSGVELGHLGDSSSVIAHGSVHINGEAGGKVGEESNGGEGNSVHVTEGEGSVHDEGQDQDGDDGGLVSEGNSVDHVGGGSSLATVGDLTDGTVRVGRVVLGDESNDESSDGSHHDANSSLPRVEREDSGSDGGRELEAAGEEGDGSEVHGGGHEDGGGNQLRLEGTLDIGLGLDRSQVGGNERAQKADEDSDGRHNNGEDHGTPAVRGSDAASNDKSGTGRLGERSEKIGSHTSNISDVVTDVVGNGGRVARVILGDSVNDLWSARR